MYSLTYKKYPLPPILRSLTLATVLPHSLNKCVCGSLTSVATLKFRFGGTSHTPETLGDIVIGGMYDE